MRPTIRRTGNLERLAGFEPAPYGLEDRCAAVKTPQKLWLQRRESNPRETAYETVVNPILPASIIITHDCGVCQDGASGRN